MFFPCWRLLPADQVKRIGDYLKSGKPSSASVTPKLNTQDSKILNVRKYNQRKWPLWSAHENAVYRCAPEMIESSLLAVAHRRHVGREILPVRVV